MSFGEGLINAAGGSGEPGEGGVGAAGRSASRARWDVRLNHPPDRCCAFRGDQLEADSSAEAIRCLQFGIS